MTWRAHIHAPQLKMAAMCIGVTGGCIREAHARARGVGFAASGRCRYSRQSVRPGVGEGQQGTVPLRNPRGSAGFAQHIEHGALSVIFLKKRCNVIGRERRGDYLGKTVQVMPHITNEIHEWIERVAHILVDNAGRCHREAWHR